MIYGETRTVTYKERFTGRTWQSKSVYKYASWHEWHTDNEGDGLWRGDKQLVGLCQFSVAGCKTLKAAKAKIRNYARAYEGEKV